MKLNYDLLFAQSLTDNLIWGAPDWFLPAIAIGVVLALLVVWAYVGVRGGSGLRTLATLLKLAAVALLALCLLEPMRSGERPRPHANVLPILVDTSQSMQLKSSSGSETRAERIAGHLDEGAPWLSRLSQSFDVRNYTFDVRLESVDRFSDVESDGDVSSLTTSLESLSQRFAEKPVAGAVLFTDGNLTDAPDKDFDWGSLGFPVYPVVPRNSSKLRDLRIVEISVRQTDFESAPTTVAVRFDASGYDGEEIVAQLKDIKNDTVVEKLTSIVPDDGESGQVTFRFRPEESGVSFHHVSLYIKGESKLLKANEDEVEAAKSSEATLANNRQVVAINRASGPYRILYLAGRPNWEFKFLRRALQEEAEVQLVGLIRIAKEEPKFTFREKGVTDTNPLFQGLGDDEEEAAEQYDEPVIVRLGVKESEELSDGFPDNSEELFAYHGIILDDIETDFFTQDQMLLIRRFVSARGGGLLMLGGTESFADKEFGDTPLGELSPVYPRRRSDAKQTGPFAMALSREGLLQPWVRLRETEDAERNRLSEMSPFQTLNTVGDVKPGASQLATVSTVEGEQQPALVSQRFGKGRTAAILLGDVWRWSMRRGAEERDDPAQAWRQLTRWLVNDVPRRAEVSIEANQTALDGFPIVARARDESYLPLDNANVELTITPPSGQTFTIKPEMDDSEAGTYRATCWSREPGGYLVTADITAADGTHVGTTQSGWAAQPAAAEFAELGWNRELLESIAKQTGGEVIYDDRLEGFADDLPTRKVPVTETWVYPLWHRPWVMIVAMLCLCCEWGLRRWKGLA